MADGGGSATKTDVGGAGAASVRKPKAEGSATTNVVRRVKSSEGGSKHEGDKSAKSDVRASTTVAAAAVRRPRSVEGTVNASDSSVPKPDGPSSEVTVARKPSRRSPTTGHRRKKVDMKRSQSSPREPIVPTSSDDEGRSLPRRRSLSPPGPEPKKVLRRRHRLRDKSLETKEEPPKNDSKTEEVKPPIVTKPKKDEVKPKKDDTPTKDVTPEKPVEQKSNLKKSEPKLDHQKAVPPEPEPPKTDKEPKKDENVKLKDKVKESESESDNKNSRPNSWWGGWSPFKRKEPKADLEATGDEKAEVEKIDDYLTTDDETAAEFIKILAETKIKPKPLEGPIEPKIETKPIPKIEEKTPLLPKREPTVKSWIQLFRESRVEFAKFKKEFPREVQILTKLRNRCFCELFLIFIVCGCGAFVFKTTEGAFENFYKCGVKRVKRDFIEDLWRSSHFMKEEDWKSKARNKLMEFEEKLGEAFEAGMTTYSGQRSWSFVNGIIYCLTVVTTIGYGHIAPVTTSGRALTIAYSIIGIPLFLILLADFGKLFTRCIKFLWAFVRRLYYTGSCRKVRRTGPVQEVMKSMQMVYDSIRRPSMFPQDMTVDVPMESGTPGEPPSTPALSTFAVDDEFNLPISVAISILLVYIFMGATVFWFWEEDWTFFESFYFVFISMSTIGFGDLVPKNQMYMMASIVYLAFGLALTSMCINVVQEKLSDSFRKASAKIGATIGLKVSEDDGTISPISPTHVEIAGVHRPISQFEPDVGPKVP